MKSIQMKLLKGFNLEIILIIHWLMKSIKMAGSGKKLPFETIQSSDLIDFPEMTEKDLKRLSTGSYRYKQAVPYLAETNWII